MQPIERIWIQTKIIVKFCSILPQVLHKVVVFSILCPPSIDVMYPLSSVNGPIVQQNESSHTFVLYSVHDAMMLSTIRDPKE